MRVSELVDVVRVDVDCVKDYSLTFRAAASVAQTESGQVKIVWIGLFRLSNKRCHQALGA